MIAKKNATFIECWSERSVSYIFHPTVFAVNNAYVVQLSCASHRIFFSMNRRYTTCNCAWMCLQLFLYNIARNATRSKLLRDPVKTFDTSFVIPITGTIDANFFHTCNLDNCHNRICTKRIEFPPIISNRLLVFSGVDAMWTEAWQSRMARALNQASFKYWSHIWPTPPSPVLLQLACRKIRDPRMWVRTLAVPHDTFEV